MPFGSTMMIKKEFLILFSALLLFNLVGCTMDVSAPPAATPIADVASPIAETLRPNSNSITPAPDTTIPITWADLQLSGRLIFSTVSKDGAITTPRIVSLDLGTGEIRTVFAATDNAWIYYLAVSPDANELMMSYIPPSAPNAEASTGVYSLPLAANAEPQLLFTPPTPFDRYIQVEWSPDGEYLYIVHYNQNDGAVDQPYPEYQISRMAYPGGQPEKILDHAFWPRVSPDSSKLVYVTIDPVSGANQLFIADADGSNPQEVKFSGAPQIMDAPIFSPDGSSILFSAPSPIQAYESTWWDRLMGVQIAKAHDVPSDWWSVPVSGGAATRLTQLQTIRLFASISPDKKYLASMSGEGILVMGLDGSNVRQLFFDPGVSSVVNWIP
jgi:Tol biopolymer transport system component